MSPRPLAGWSILLVADDERERSLLRMILVEAGFDVLVAGDAQTALRLLRMNAPKLVLIDARVLGRERPDLVAALHRQGPDVHVIVLTGGDEDEDVRGRARLADDTISKPFTTEGLIGHLVDLLRRRVIGGDRRSAQTAAARSDFGGTAAEAALSADIRRGLAAREFVVYYQPIVKFADRATVGYEALVRWRHPARGLLPPAAFIPAAERSELILQIGDFVLSTACRDAARWRRADHDLHVAVNLSAKQLVNGNLATRVDELMVLTALPAGALWLEVTETALIDDMAHARATLHRVQAAGASLAIDDFGTGWASLTYLRLFPSHTLKIDRSFVSGLGRDPSDLAIVRSILLLARELDLVVVAEGVEREEQAHLLLEMGCDMGQGFLFGHPAPFRA